jgi:hypothetical protein
MMNFRMAVVIVALAPAGTVATYAQVQPPQERIDTALSRARQVGIPVSLLESKIAEGKAKGVSQERIAAAIERREAVLERASQALRGEADAAASLAVGADAIESGVNEAVLKAVAENAPRDRRNVAIAALTQLVQQGQVPEAALERVRDALKRGPDALANLPGESGSNRRGNGSSDGSGSGSGSGNSNGSGSGSGGGSGSGSGSGGSGGGQSGRDPGPPSGVPAPGKSPQSGKPNGSSGSSGSNSGSNTDGGNPSGRGRR